MRTRVYKLYASAAADTNSAASITIQTPGVITAFLMGVGVNSVTDGNIADWELSFASSWQGATNDTIGPIGQLRSRFEDAGTAANSQNVEARLLVDNIAIPLVAGDRLYLNVDITGTVTTTCHCYVYVAI